MGYGWEGSRVRLVPLDRSRHFESCLRWINDPEATEWLLIGDLPIGRMAESDFFDRQERGVPDEIVFAIETKEGEYIGNSGLHGINYRHGVAISGTFVGEPSKRGLGLGTEAAMVRARYAFEVLGLRMLLSSYLEGNRASARMQEKVGYRIAGVIPERFWKRGAYRGEVMTYLTLEAFEEASFRLTETGRSGG